MGRVGRAHGIRGDVAIDVRTDEPDRRFAAGTTFATARGKLTVESSRWHGARLLIRFEQVPDRTAAEALQGTELRLDVAPAERPEDPEEFYDHQLVGLSARLESGELLGPVTDVLHLPAQDVLVLDHDGREILVPFIADFVPTVDLESAAVVIRPAPGLLSDLEES